MILRRPRRSLIFLTCLALAAAALPAQPGTQSPSSSKSSSSAKSANKPTTAALDPGAITNNVYRNKTLALSCKIPDGWVLRTEELNARDEKKEEEKEAGNIEGTKDPEKKDVQPTPSAPAPSTGAKVLLAAFSRPPEARAEDVNSSILIAAESAASCVRNSRKAPMRGAAASSGRHRK